jgi:hypothetical protein
MQPYVSIVCQEGGHAVALEYAKLVGEAGLPILVNFPNAEDYLVASNPEQFLGPRTAALILILSRDVFFPAERLSSKFRINLEIIRVLLTASTTAAKSRLFIVVTDEASELRIKGTWLSSLQYNTDNAIAREEMLAKLHTIAKSENAETEISSFNNVESIISAMEPSSTIERIALERSSTDKISYEIFKCTNRFRSTIQYYIHLHRAVTITNTARHLVDNHIDVYSSKDKVVLLSIEKGQTRIDERISNIKQTFKSDNVFYLENIASQLVSDSVGLQPLSRTDMAGRTFVEPQVRRGIGENVPPSDYAMITDWLAGSSSGIMVLVGQGGIGKTWSMMDLRSRITQRTLSFSKPITKGVVFITSTDVARGFSRLPVPTEYITLYDLYCASCAARDEDENRNDRLTRETFYDALELGSLVIFVDGLDEIITRHRARFSGASFFNDLAERLTGDSDGKVVVSCRNIFFDHEEARFAFPYVETFELLGFDAGRRKQFFQDALGDMPGRLSKAVQLSDQMAVLPSKLYVPFVLDLIKELMLEQADVTPSQFEIFQSDILNSSDANDRIVGQFCQRETLKVLDPIRELSVDDQVRIFCEIARLGAASRGKVDREALGLIVTRVTGRRDADGYVNHLIAHPFISQEEFSNRGVIDFRFDFMPEYFLILDAIQRFDTSEVLGEDDIRIFNKYCSMNSPFCLGLARRISSDSKDVNFRLLQIYEQGLEVIDTHFSEDDRDIGQPESAAARFSFAIVSLVAAFQTLAGSLVASNFTSALCEVFGRGSVLSRMALLDGFVRDEERIRIDFRGLRFEDCLFHAVDIWSCQFDANSSFSRCRFMSCLGVFSKGSGIREATFEPDCHLDAEFERVFAEGQERIKSTQGQNLDAIRSFISDFYRQGGFRRISYRNLERYYGSSNSFVPFKQLYRLMKKHGVISEEDHGHYTEVRVASRAQQAAEKLITQGVLGGALRDVAGSL